MVLISFTQTNKNRGNFSVGTFSPKTVAQTACDAANQVMKEAYSTTEIDDDIELVKAKAKRAAAIASGVHAAVVISTKSGELLGGFLKPSGIVDKACGVDRVKVYDALKKKSGQVGKSSFYVRRGTEDDPVGLSPRGIELLHCDEYGNDV